MTVPILAGLALAVLPAALCLAKERVHHDLKATVDPQRGTLSAEDRVILPQDTGGRPLHFLLHEGLRPVIRTPGVTLARENREPKPGDFLPSEGPGDGPGGVRTELYRVDLPSGTRAFTVAYGGEIRHRIRDAGEEYARGFGQTPGYIGPEGVYLAGESAWCPWLGDGLVTFRLQVDTPEGWEAVSQGRRTLHERGRAGTRSRWESPEPQDEIYLVGGPLTEYSSEAARTQALAFLRTPDPALAAKYLEATDRYLEMYSKLLGPYPYPKFALVENFWESGYGMPSFTLLGEKIIRFPFILTSSYPHEILHNWWGNGVFVDYASGNWSEGLTAYLSDHLFQEQRGEGAEHRQATLQKYADYAARSKDFPLRAFLSRHSSATEAVGYGKALMFFHMLRRDLGDETFVAALREFYRANLFRFASYSDLRKAVEAVAKADFRPAFAQWVDRTGAPRLRIKDARARREGEGFVATAVLEQTQPGALYRLRVPLAVTLEGTEAAYQISVTLEHRSRRVKLRVPRRPLRLDVDPEFDLFRLLDREEIPPALSGLFGAEAALIVLPSEAPEPMRKAYRELAEEWAGARPDRVEIELDSKVRDLPTDRAVWVFGWENRLRGDIGTTLSPYAATLEKDGLRIGASWIPLSGHSAVLSVRNPRAPDQAVGWLASDRPEPLPGLGRKLPHYHKWSYLGFEGDEPSNVLKGRWPVLRSPLTVLVADEKGRTRSVERGRLRVRPPLAELLPVFSKQAMLETIRFLSGEELRGRALGSDGLDRAAEHIAEGFRNAGLRPGGDGGRSYFQSWTERPAGRPGEVRLRNVIGVLPGKNRDWAGQSVVVGAHYDGQGLGLPGGRAEDRGKIHPGADDNASGVAVLLELARVLSGTAPDRSIVFAAFTGEEEGRLGSRHYVAAEESFPVAKALAMVNLDTVGRMGKKLFALGAGSAREWIHIFMGAGYSTGVTVESVAADVGGSDQVSFLDAGVPAVQLFTGPHLDYHRPTDTHERIDLDGLARVAAVAKEAVEHLTARPEPLTRPGAPAAAAAPGGEGGRKVSLGTVPDFAYGGAGVRLAGVVPGSPAERAGLREGDVIVRLGAAAVKSLRDLSAALKALEPGEAVRVTFEREGTERTAEARIEAR